MENHHCYLLVRDGIILRNKNAFFFSCKTNFILPDRFFFPPDSRISKGFISQQGQIVQGGKGSEQIGGVCGRELDNNWVQNELGDSWGI